MQLLRNIRKTLKKPQPRDGHMHTAAQWDQAYKTGTWDFLEKSIAELCHYSAVAAYVQHFTPGGRILDVGCGPGVLTRYVRPHGYAEYFGIDVSEEAIRKASHLTDEQTHFMKANVEEFVPPSTHDCIVFNECLYYLKQPLVTLRRYSQRLADNGYVIVSMYGDNPPVQKIWQLLDAHYQPRDKVQVKHVPSGTFWNIALYEKKSLIAPSS